MQLLLAGGDVSQQHPSVEEPHANDKWPSHLLTLYLKILTYLSSVGQCRATHRPSAAHARPRPARPRSSRLHVACPPWPIRGPAEASVEEPHANDKWPSHLLTLYLKILTYLSSVGQCHATSALRRTRPPAARPPVPAACTSRLHVACPPWPIRGPAEASIVVSTCMPSLAHTR